MAGLFSGIGGFELAATRTGMEVLWMCEIDPYCRQVLAKHWPGVPVYADVRTLDGATVARPDVLCGGFPCQPWSVAGKRREEGDHRHLWPEMARLVQELQPRWVVGENVPGLARNLGHEQVCADLEAAGYEVATVNLPACAFGAPHLRERLWIVGWHAHGERQPHRPFRSLPQEPAAYAGRGGHAPDADGLRCGWGLQQPQRAPQREGTALDRADGGTGHPADTDRERQQQPRRDLGEGRRRPGDGCEADVPHANGQRREEPGAGRGGGVSLIHAAENGPAPADAGAGSRWGTPHPEPGIRRVAHGVPYRVDRVRALGNAIVPAVAEQLFRWIAEAERAALGGAA